MPDGSNLSSILGALPQTYSTPEESLAAARPSPAAPPAAPSLDALPQTYSTPEESLAAPPAPTPTATLAQPAAVTSLDALPQTYSTPEESLAAGQAPAPSAAAPAQPGEAQPPQETGFFSGLISGVGASGREAAQLATGNAFTTDPNAQPEPTRGWFNELGYGIGHSVPVIGGGLAGGAAGGAVGGPVGATIGAALGVGGTSLLQDLVPTYQSAVQGGMSHDEAVDYSVKHALATGAIGAATAPLFELAPFKSAIGKILFQSLATQPAVGAAGRVGVPLVMGEPLPSAEDLVRGAGQDIATGAAFGVGHQVGGRVVEAIRPRPGPVGEAPPVSEPPPGPAVVPPAPVPDVSTPAAIPRDTAPATESVPGPAPERTTEPVPVPPPAEVPVAQAAPATPASETPVPSETVPTPPVQAPPARTENETPSSPDPAKLDAINEHIAAGKSLAYTTQGDGTITVGPSLDTETHVPVTLTAGEQRAFRNADLDAESTDPQERAAGKAQVQEILKTAVQRVTLPPDDGRSIPAGPEPTTGVGEAGAARLPAEQPGGVRPGDTAVGAPDTQAAPPTDQGQTGQTPPPFETGPTSGVAPGVFGPPKEAQVPTLAPAPGPVPETGPGTSQTPQTRGDQYRAAVAELDARNAPDSDYRSILSTGAKNPLRKGETWRGRVLDFARQADAEGVGPETTGPTPNRFADLDRQIAARDALAAQAPGLGGANEARVVRLDKQIAAHEQALQASDPQLTKLRATRDALTAQPVGLGGTNEARVAQLDKQIAARERTLQAKVRQTPGGPRVGGRKQPFTGPPEVGASKGLNDYKFNNGTSVWQSVLDEAGHSADLAINKPVAWQVKVLTDHMKNKFGFRGVEVVGRQGKDATPVDQKVARDAMLDMTRSITDGMATLGEPYAAASNNGQVKLVLEPRGSTGYHGVYSTAGEIRIVGGANSFGHEWTHAIDHTVAERLTGNPAQMNKLLSQYARDGVLNPRDGVQAAMAKLINIHFYKREAQAARQLALEITAAKTDRLGQPTQGALEAQRQLDLLERGGSLLHIEPSAFREASMDFHPPKRGYYGSIMELLGRSHEAYLAREMQNAGVDPRGFVMPDEAYINETDRALKMLYPKADDRSDIFAGWAEFHRQMRNEMVLSQGKPPGAFSDLGISDPSRLSVTAPMSGGTALAGWLREEANRYANFTKNLAGVGLYDKSRPDPGDKTLTRRIADTFRAVGFASHSMAETIIKRAPEGARPYLREIMDRWTPAPGEGRYTGASLEEARQNRETEWLRRYGNILNKHGLDPRTMTNEENDMIRHVMTTGEDRFPTDPLDPNSPTKPIPANLIRVAGKDGLRPLLDEGWATSDAAGLDTGYAKSGYFPRLWDIAKIFANPARFREAAGKLHALIFDQEVGAPGKDPTALLEKWTTLSGTDRDNAPAELATQMEQLAKSMRRQRQIEEQLNTPFSSGNPVTLRAELAALKTEIQQQAEAAHALLRDHIAETASGNWFARLMRAGHHDFDTVGPSGKYLNARVLPPETDTIMREFLRTNINDAIPNYLIAVARRTADAERFGAHGEDLDRLLDAAARVPGMDGNDLIQFENLTNNVRGRISYRNLGPLQKIHNAIQTYGAVVTMPRALWASLAEPMNGGLATGEMRVPFKIFASQFGQLMRTASSRERSELADFLNVTTSPMHDTVMLSRMSADYSDSPLLNRLMGWYYRVTGLTQLTNSQRIGATAGGDWFLNKLAQHYQDEGTDTAAVNRRDNATRWFRELGLNDPIHADFAKWMTDKNGALPSPHQLLTDATGMAGAYGLAMRRLVNRIIQQPTAADRPMMARVPIIGLAYQLMHFNYQFARNVLNPAIGQVEHAYSRARAQGSGRLGATAVGAGAAVHAASMAGAMVGVGLMTTMVRQALFAPDQWKKHEEDGDLWDYLLGLAMQRSGLNGTLDPIIQVATNLRYNADLSSLLDGASMNWIAKNAQDVIQPLVSANDSPNTNTRYFNAARGAFNLIGVPAAAIGLTTLGAVGGPISRAVAGAALQYGTSPASASGFAGMVAGEKGAQLPKETKPGELPELPGPASLPSLPSLSSEQDQSAQDQGAGGGLLPWGLMDDVAVPAWRVAAPMLSRLPGPVKAGALGLGALTGAKSFLDTTAPWRGEDARPPKAAEQAAQP